MLKKIIIGGIVIVVAIWGVGSVFHSSSKPPQNTEKTTPTQAIADVKGVTATVAPTQTPDVTTPPLTNQQLCQTLAPKLRTSATNFMNAHKAHNSSEVLSTISQPESDDDSIKLDYLMGNDTTGDGVRLYVTQETLYTTVSFTLSTISYAGQDMNDRGNDLCSMVIYETRKTDTQGQVSQQTVTRYIDFTISPDQSFQIQAFKGGKKGTKYSGFN